MGVVLGVGVDVRVGAGVTTGVTVGVGPSVILTVGVSTFRDVAVGWTAVVWQPTSTPRLGAPKHNVHSRAIARCRVTLAVR